jgi:hypothetical protein
VKKIKLLLSVGLVLLVLSPLSTVFANSAPPQAAMWFTFKDDSSTHPSIVDVEVYKCESSACNDAAQLSVNSRFCFEDWCYLGVYPEHGNDYQPYSSDDPDPEDSYFRVVVKFSDDQQLISNVLEGLPVQYGQEAYFIGTVEDDSVQLAEAESFRWPGLSFSLVSFAITLFFETAVTFLIVLFLFRSNLDLSIRMAALAVIDNLISYPI